MSQISPHSSSITGSIMSSGNSVQIFSCSSHVCDGFLCFQVLMLCLNLCLYDVPWWSDVTSSVPRIFSGSTIIHLTRINFLKMNERMNELLYIHWLKFVHLQSVQQARVIPFTIILTDLNWLISYNNPFNHLMRIDENVQIQNIYEPVKEASSLPNGFAPQRL